MKVHIEIDCTPEEARSFMGLPDLTRAQEAYSEQMERAMRGVSTPDQLQELAKSMAPMGQAGLKFFQAFMETSAANAARNRTSGSGDSKSED